MAAMSKRTSSSSSSSSSFSSAPLHARSSSFVSTPLDFFDAAIISELNDDNSTVFLEENTVDDTENKITKLSTSDTAVMEITPQSRARASLIMACMYMVMGLSLVQCGMGFYVSGLHIMVLSVTGLILAMLGMVQLIITRLGLQGVTALVNERNPIVAINMLGFFLNVGAIVWVLVFSFGITLVAAGGMFGTYVHLRGEDEVYSTVEHFAHMSGAQVEASVNVMATLASTVSILNAAFLIGSLVGTFRFLPVPVISLQSFLWSHVCSGTGGAILIGISIHTLNHAAAAPITHLEAILLRLAGVSFCLATAVGLLRLSWATSLLEEEADRLRRESQVGRGLGLHEQAHATSAAATHQMEGSFYEGSSGGGRVFSPSGPVLVSTRNSSRIQPTHGGGRETNAQDTDTRTTTSNGSNTKAVGGRFASNEAHLLDSINASLSFSLLPSSFALPIEENSARNNGSDKEKEIPEDALNFLLFQEKESTNPHSPASSMTAIDIQYDGDGERDDENKDKESLSLPISSTAAFASASASPSSSSTVSARALSSRPPSRPNVENASEKRGAVTVAQDKNPEKVKDPNTGKIKAEVEQEDEHERVLAQNSMVAGLHVYLFYLALFFLLAVFFALSNRYLDLAEYLRTDAGIQFVSGASRLAGPHGIGFGGVTHNVADGPIHLAGGVGAGAANDRVLVTAGLNLLLYGAFLFIILLFAVVATVFAQDLNHFLKRQWSGRFQGDMHKSLGRWRKAAFIERDGNASAGIHSN